MIEDLEPGLRSVQMPVKLDAVWHAIVPVAEISKATGREIEAIEDWAERNRADYYWIPNASTGLNDRCLCVTVSRMRPSIRLNKEVRL